MRGLVDTMDTYGPARAGRYVSFLKLFPNLFKITGSGPGIRVMKAVAGSSADNPRESSASSASSALYERYEAYKKAIGEARTIGSISKDTLRLL